MTRLLAVIVLLLGTALAAPTLSVNGREVAGLTLSLVDGVSYAPAAPYAQALGARLMIDYNSGLASLELGGRMAVVPTAVEPTTSPVSWNVNGESRQAPAAIFFDGQLFLPVSAVAQAFLGYTTYVPERERVMVVTPRGRIADLSATRRGSTDRIVVELASNVPYSLYYNEPVDRLELRFDRTDGAGVGQVEGGRWFTRAAAVTSAGSAEVRVSLAPGAAYSVYTVPAGRGYRLVIDLFARPEETASRVAAPRIVIDPAHGGEDEGMDLAGGLESARTLQIAVELARALEARGYDVALSRDDDFDVPLSARSGASVGAELFLSLHVHPTPDGVASVYYLDEAGGAASLDMAIRQNAATALEGTTDSLRRRLLLNLVPDVAVGRRFAQGIQGELFASAGISVADAEGAPLAVLEGAAGRGLLLELPAEAASPADVVTALADAIVSLLPLDQAAAAGP